MVGGGARGKEAGAGMELLGAGLQRLEGEGSFVCPYVLVNWHEFLSGTIHCSLVNITP
jgi:hypothetical protein